jgi:peptidoglycan/xylan/chitin deacetylase (PgdA/CDA1 family)
MPVPVELAGIWRLVTAQAAVCNRRVTTIAAAIKPATAAPSTSHHSQYRYNGLMKRILGLLFLGIMLSAAAVAGDKKLIALTFDDGPRPYVLLGTKATGAPPGLLDLLDRQKVKATFFVMGWRLTPKTFGDRREPNIGVTCLDAAQLVRQHGHEIENHTYSHIQLRLAERQHGEAWVLGDIDRGARLIQAVTHAQPRYLRPPDWIMWAELQKKLEDRGYTVMSISPARPLALRDVNSQDYLCAGAHPAHCPKPSLAAAVIRQIAARERQGGDTHILVFHELSTTVASLETLVPELQARGYKFVTLDQYMKEVGAGH